MREDKLLLGCQRYIGDSLGAAFTQGQPWTLDGMLPDTTALTPIIFILTSGADPTAMLQVRLRTHAMCSNISVQGLGRPKSFGLRCIDKHIKVMHTAPIAHWACACTEQAILMFVFDIVPRDLLQSACVMIFTEGLRTFQLGSLCAEIWREARHEAWGAFAHGQSGTGARACCRDPCGPGNRGG